jgi:hypothetical protein
MPKQDEEMRGGGGGGPCDNNKVVLDLASSPSTPQAKKWVLLEHLHTHLLQGEVLAGAHPVFVGTII